MGSRNFGTLLAAPAGGGLRPVGGIARARGAAVAEFRGTVCQAFDREADGCVVSGCSFWAGGC